MSTVRKKTSLWLLLFASIGVQASDPLLEIDTSKRGVLVSRERSLMDYAEVARFNSRTDAPKILVTTRVLAPDARSFAAAESFSEGLSKLYPTVDFKVFGRVNGRELAARIREAYDYVFLVNANSSSTDYEYDETVYSSRGSAISCSRSLLNSDVNCRETSTVDVPIGSRRSERSIFVDAFSISYGLADGLGSGAIGNDEQGYKPSLHVNAPVGHIAVRILHGESQASSCENEGQAQVNLARMTGLAGLPNKPDKVELTVAAGELGCDD